MRWPAGAGPGGGGVKADVVSEQVALLPSARTAPPRSKSWVWEPGFTSQGGGRCTREGGGRGQLVVRKMLQDAGDGRSRRTDRDGRREESPFKDTDRRKQ